MAKRGYLFLMFVLLAVPVIIKAKLSREAKELAEIYHEDDETYFGGKLPKQITFSYVLSDPVGDMAETTFPATGQYHIAVGPKWMTANMTKRLLMLHEECHVYAEDKRPTETGYHSGEWRACMLNLEMQGAFRDILIYGKEDRP